MAQLGVIRDFLKMMHILPFIKTCPYIMYTVICQMREMLPFEEISDHTYVGPASMWTGQL